MTGARGSSRRRRRAAERRRRTPWRAIAGIARESWAHPKDLFALFEEAYPQTKEGLPNAAPFAPYLLYAPSDFALVLRFSGGGIYAPGRLMFDAEGNLWSGVNWMPGSQSSAVTNIGGGVAKFGPDGAALSPPVTGFMGAGINGVGWGTAVTRDNVWVSSFNGKILVMDLQGRPVASEQDFPFREKLSGLMGIGVAANGDVWIADGEGGQLLFFPGGRVKEGKIVKVPGLAGPFDVVIDDQNRVWVSNSRSDTVMRFPASDPTKVETFRVGLAPRALALDSKSNVWVANFISPDFPGLKPLPPHATIMQEFQAFSALLGPLESGRVKSTGFVSMIRPDGSQPSPQRIQRRWGRQPSVGNQCRRQRRRLDDQRLDARDRVPGRRQHEGASGRNQDRRPSASVLQRCVRELHGRDDRRRGQCLVRQQLE